MIISLDRSRHSSSRAAAFTLVEVMVSGTLAAIVMAGVIATFLMIARSSVRVANYADMEKQTRVAFQRLGIDARMASDLTSHLNGSVVTAITLTIPSSDVLIPTRTVTYGFANSTFFYVPGSDKDETTGRESLIKNVSSMTFDRFDKSSVATTSDATVKHIQANVNVVRTGSGVAKSTQVIRSTAFTIRNKSS